MEYSQRQTYIWGHKINLNIFKRSKKYKIRSLTTMQIKDEKQKDITKYTNIFKLYNIFLNN